MIFFWILVFGGVFDPWDPHRTLCRVVGIDFASINAPECWEKWPKVSDQDDHPIDQDDHPIDQDDHPNGLLHACFNPVDGIN